MLLHSLRLRRLALLAAGCLFLTNQTAIAQDAYQLFESGPVRPMALSPNGQKLFVVNTPDGHVDLFDVDTYGNLTAVTTTPPFSSLVTE